MKRLILLAIITISITVVFLTHSKQEQKTTNPPVKETAKPAIISENIKTSDAIKLKPLEEKKIVSGVNHMFQTFNNCGPASLSMALSFYGINKSQQELGQALRPYQNALGDNDDKSVTLAELAKKASEYNFVTYHRPIGNIELLKQFVNNDMPVITRTWLKPNEDIGHFRIVKGFDNNKEVIIQDDSLQGKNLEYTYEEFNEIWKKFNYEYLILVPKEKVQIAEAIMRENKDENKAWKNATMVAQATIAKKQNDIDTRFNLSVAYYNVGRYQDSIDAFEKVQNQISKRALWYQIEPILAYYNLEKYDKVFEISDQILNNGNRAYSELYLIRGNSYLKQGKKDLAKQEFENAVKYNTNLEEAKIALSKVQ